MSGQLRVYVWPDLITSATNRRTEVDAQLGGLEATRAEDLHGYADDPTRGPTPTGMNERHGAGPVCEEDRDAVGDRDSQAGPPLGRYVSVGVVAAEPPRPARPVYQDSGAVYLH